MNRFQIDNHLDYLTKTYPCKKCGKKSDEWVKLDLSTNTCVCRNYQKIKNNSPGKNLYLIISKLFIINILKETNQNRSGQLKEL